jgi:hypothetical protein
MCPSPDVLRPMQPAVGDMTGAHVSDERRVVPSVYRALCTSTLDNIQHVLEKFTQPTLGAGPGGTQPTWRGGRDSPLCVGVRQGERLWRG